MASRYVPVGPHDREEPHEFERWCAYYAWTEQYDRGWPSRWSLYDQDCWLPDDPYRAGCTANARTLLRRLRLRLLDGPCPARHHALSLTHDERARIAADWSAQETP